MVTDREGRAHKPAGSSEGGQFSSRRTPAPAGSLAGHTVGISEAAQAIGVSTSHLRQMANDGRVSVAGTTLGGHRRFDLDDLMTQWEAIHRHAGADWSGSYELADLSDDTVPWREMVAALGSSMPQNVYDILSYAVTELTNNAMDHSGGTWVKVSARAVDGSVEIEVADDGIGVFRSLATGHGLPDDADALVELTKGKRTTAPERHAGEGLFFTMHAVDYASVSSNGYVLAASTAQGDDRFAAGSSSNSGTIVTARVSTSTQRTLVEVFEEFTTLDEGAGTHAFSRTIPRVSLLPLDGDFVSRSEAKRLAAGLDRFTEVELDFDGVHLIGQGFADELFRVWQNDHPSVRLIPINASRGVQFMIGRALSAR